QKQRLVKFPEEFDPNVAPPTSEKTDEAKRILEQIAKVNEAFGYVKKQPEQPKLPPILDSSQYLFPKPAYTPFHNQQHHFTGGNGQTLLEPSIRAVKLTRNVGGINYNVPSKTRLPNVTTEHKEKPSAAPSPMPASSSSQLYFRPNRVIVPKPVSAEEAQQLPAHFVIPVHLYKLNKEQYLKEQAPQEYRIKGYKIIGDVDSFYGKAKSMLNDRSRAKQGKSTPKYHLFFLPRELALNEDGTPKRGNSTTTTTTTTTRHPTLINSKESRLDSREKPVHKPQSIHLPRQQPEANSLNANRKRVSSSTAKPTKASAKEVQPLVNNKVTSAPVHILSTLPPSGGLLPNRNRLNPFRVPSVNLAEMQNHTSMAIKNAFTNIFKMPFQGSPLAPAVAAGSTPTVVVGSTLNQQQPQHLMQASLSDSQDYKWDDEKEGAGDGDSDGFNDDLDTVENTAAEQDSSTSAEKHLFAHKAHHLMQTVGQVATAHQSTQKQALREGGIIIQRLKVRKGGIAIAGPGGVATAGSGGTAIVGPGGYALTHPRSLTIAGPGAKVISIPPEVDLKDALQRTNLEAKSFPREGKVVATGPTVYYAPPTGTEASEYDEEAEFESEA
ncbi:uncharacterized protein, partial [Drosophila tropicalis]|uniref:uncharacterized protein n=1 Tax=Drosophila tropicalis TaxID=46794 RepID=UPI0035ABD6B9